MFKRKKNKTKENKKENLTAIVNRKELKLHLGCGNVILKDWVNVDMEKMQPEIIPLELPEGLKLFLDNSVQYIYTSHFLEHLEYPGTANALIAECHRILKPEGAIRIVVPGIENIINAYVANDKDFFNVQKTMHPQWCTTKLEHLMYALQQDGEHKYGYDFETMKKLLSDNGFTKIYNSSFNESVTTDLNIDYTGKGLSLFVDAIK